MSITNIENKSGSQATNISAVVNQLSLIVGFDDAATADQVCQAIQSIRILCREKPNRLLAGSITDIDAILTDIYVDRVSSFRQDLQHWVVDICLTTTSGTYLFVSGSLETLTLLSNIVETAIIVSDLPVNATDVASTARERLNDIKSVAERRDPRIPKERKFVLLSERVYDSLQSLQHLHRLSEKHPTRFDCEVLILDNVSIVDKNFAESILSQKVETLDHVAFSKLRSNPNIDSISSLDWHWPPQSTATVENLASLLKKMLLQPPHQTRAGRRLFISLELEKRVWVQQEEVLLQTIEYLRREFGIDEVLINGMTAPAAADPTAPFFEDIFVREKDFAHKLQLQSSELKITHLHNRGLTKKISEISNCIYFLCPLGSAALIPIICDVPGICFGTRDFLNANQNLIPVDRERFKIIDPNIVEEIEEDLSVKKYFWSTNTIQGKSYKLSYEDFMDNLIPHARKYLEYTVND